MALHLRDRWHFAVMLFWCLVGVFEPAWREWKNYVKTYKEVRW